jgi:zinc protease
MREEGPTAQELADAKTYLTGSYPLQFDSTGRIAGALVDIQQEKLGIDYLEKRNSYIEAVTLDDAKRVARRLLDPAALAFAVVGSPANLKPTREIAPNGS